jgi:hypothetical protein
VGLEVQDTGATTYYPHHDLFVCCPGCSQLLSPSFGKNHALNPVEFTEVQESGNNLLSCTSAEVTSGFQHESFFSLGGHKFVCTLWVYRKHIYVFIPGDGKHISVFHSVHPASCVDCLVLVHSASFPSCVDFVQETYFCFPFHFLNNTSCS